MNIPGIDFDLGDDLNMLRDAVNQTLHVPKVQKNEDKIILFALFVLCRFL